MITEAETTPDVQRARQLALILKAIDDEEMALAEITTEFKSRIEKLRHDARRVQQAILGGQMELPTEVTPPPEKAA